MNLKMKFKKVLLTLLAIMLIGAQTLAYADEIAPEGRPAPTQSEEAQENLGEIYHRAGLDSPEVIINTLANLGISSEELQEAVGQGKKINDLLEEKKITPKKFKKALTKEYRCRIKKAAQMKVITKEEAKILNDLLKEKMNKWEV